MRDFSKVSPSVWRSRKFRNLPSDNERFLYLYILTCPHGNSGGCFDLPEGYGMADMGWSLEPYRKGIDTLSKVGLIATDPDEDTVFITNWFAFNAPSNMKHALGIIREINKASAGPLKLRSYQSLKGSLASKGWDCPAELQGTIDTLSKRYGDGIDTVSPQKTETKTETETETRPDQDREKTKTRARSALPAEVAAPRTRRMPGGTDPNNRLVAALARKGV